MNRPAYLLHLSILLMGFLASAMNNARAAITWSGNVEPVDPTTWLDEFIGIFGTGIVGRTADGNVRVDGGSDLLSANGYIGVESGVVGEVVIDGIDSTWTNSNLLSVGLNGEGTLEITNGGYVSSLWSGIGDNEGSKGTITVDGLGSAWDNSSRVSIGRRGEGILNITGGGTVSNRLGYIGLWTDSVGRVVVDGANSTLATDDYLVVGSLGEGLLSISNSGEVDVTGLTWVGQAPGTNSKIEFDGGTLNTGGLHFSVDDLTGTGTINAHGLISDFDLVFDASQGFRKTFLLNELPGQDIVLNLDVDGSGSMGAGYAGSGTLSISDGVEVESTLGYIGYRPGSNGVVTVEGAGSAWTNVGGLPTGSESFSYLYVGGAGSASLEVADGGAVSNFDGYIAFGIGSTGQVTVDGAGSIWTNTSQFIVGGLGDAELSLSNGGTVTSGICKVADHAGSTGQISVDGLDSTWTNLSILIIGDEGDATLSITDGGTVINDYIGIIGSSTGSTGHVLVNGGGSKWSESRDVVVGSYGAGLLTITQGGLVSVGRTLTIDQDENGDSFINMMTGGMLALASDPNGDDSLDDFLSSIEGTDAIRYWDHESSEWLNINTATYGDDYTLEYITTGELAGYTLLTVGIVPEPGVVKLALCGLCYSLARYRKKTQDTSCS